jgi:hypothetical protein
MTTMRKRSAETENRFQAGKKAARERVIERGIVQFRADREFMELLLKVAEEKKIPAGVLIRSWAYERLKEEAKHL